MSWAQVLRWAGLELLFRMQIGAVYIYTFILLRRGLANVLTCHFSSAICSGNITHTCDGEAWTLASKCGVLKEFDTILAMKCGVRYVFAVFRNECNVVATSI